MTAITN